MDNELSGFFDALRRIRLTDVEHQEAKKALRQFQQAHPVRKGSDLRLKGRMDPTLRLFEAARSIRLTDEERSRALAALRARMRSESPRKEHLIASVAAFLSSLRFAPALAAFLVLILGTGAGVSLAAEYALPGDTLYPVKIHVTEPLRMSLRFTALARATYEAEIIERRLLEAEQLVAENRLDAETAAQISAHVERRSKNARKDIAALRLQGETSGADDVDADLAASFVAHRTMLRSSARSHGKLRREIAAVVRGIDTASESKVAVQPVIAAVATVPGATSSLAGFVEIRVSDRSADSAETSKRSSGGESSSADGTAEASVNVQASAGAGESSSKPKQRVTATEESKFLIQANEKIERFERSNLPAGDARVSSESEAELQQKKAIELRIVFVEQLFRKTRKAYGDIEPDLHALKGTPERALAEARALIGDARDYIAGGKIQDARAAVQKIEEILGKLLREHELRAEANSSVAASVEASPKRDLPSVFP